MPAFQIVYSNVSTAPQVIIKATTRAIRIASYNYAGTNASGAIVPTFFRYASATVSGGAAQTPIPYRDGSTPTAVVNMGGTVSGTSTTIGFGLDVTFNFTIARNNALVITPPGGSTNSLQFRVTFEELPIQWAV